MYKSDYFQQKKKTLTLINYVQNEGTSKLNSKIKIKKEGTESEVRYRPRRLRRPRSAGPFPRASPHFPKEKENSK
jgi:hypothetical protein